MPKKYNRNRNTITISADGQFLKSALSGFARQSTYSAEHFSASEKTFLNLRLLEKCEQKIFHLKERQYQQSTLNQQEYNQILASIQAETIKEASVQRLKGSERFMELNREARRRNSDYLISSWTAFVNLDITFKTKEADLMKQNKVLHNKLAIMEEKLKALYPSKCTSISQEKQSEKENKENIKALSIENIERIQKRINQHQVLTEKLKEKIERKQCEKLQLKNVFQTLVGKCQQKYSQEVVQRLCQMFEKQ